MTKRKSRTTSTVAMASGVVLAMTLAACSSGSGGAGEASQSVANNETQSNQSSTPAASTAQSNSAAPSAESSQALATAAAQEGTFTWYTADSEGDVTKITAAFNKQYPNIKVVPLRLSSDKLPTRVLTEQRGGKYNADVVEADVAYAIQLVDAKALQPYSPPDAQPLTKGIDLPAGYGNVNYVHTTVIAYNPKVLKEKGLAVPTSFEDLTKPEWKGNFSVNPGAVNWYISMIGALGHDQALKLATALGNNSPRLVESHTQAVTQVQSGEPVATAMAYGWSAASFKAKTPDSVDFVHPKTFPASLDLIELAKNAPHPAAGKLFIDWEMSQQGQQAIIDATKHASLRTDVKQDATVWDPTKWPPAWAEPQSAATYTTYVKELATAFKAQ